MTTDKDALLKAIIAHPDEDTPRLAYADWLEEHGDEADRARAEFIRVQVELAQNGIKPERRRHLLKRERELLAEYQHAWFGDILKPYVLLRDGADIMECTVERGFISMLGVNCNVAESRARMDSVMAREPVTTLKLTKTNGWAEELGELEQKPWLSRIRALEFIDHSTDQEPERQAITHFLVSNTKAGKLPALEALDFNADLLNDNMLHALMASPVMGKLRHLGCQGASLPEDTLIGLLAHSEERLPKLDSLEIPVHSEAVTVALAASPLLGRLKELLMCVSPNALIPVADLIRDRDLSNLESLAVPMDYNADWEHENTQAVAGELASAHLPKLKTLQLGGWLQNNGMRVIARAEHMPALETIICDSSSSSGVILTPLLNAAKTLPALHSIRSRYVEALCRDEEMEGRLDREALVKRVTHPGLCSLRGLHLIPSPADSEEENHLNELLYKHQRRVGMGGPP